MRQTTIEASRGRGGGLQSSDAALVAGIQSGDARAFARMMRQHNRRLYRLARAVLGDDAAAEDVVQETYVRAYTHLDTWRGTASLATWLSRIALNEALTQLRRRRETVEWDEMAEQSAGIDGIFRALLMPTPEEVAAQGEVRHLIERAIDELPTTFRTVFILRAVEQMPVDEVAAALEIQPETVRTRFFRARRLLRTALGRRIAGMIEDTFPFAGARCDRIMRRVLERLELPLEAMEPAASPRARGAPPSE